MKKLILSAITALVFLFGFTSCAGNFHDAALPVSMYIIGSATKAGWSGAENQKMTLEGTKYSIVTDLSAGEFKFVSENPTDPNWTNVKTQWGEDGEKNNAKSWVNSNPGQYEISYDIATGKMTVISFSTALDDPQKIATVPWLYGGIGSVKLEKDRTTYTGSFSVGDSGKGGWGEEQGFIRCALISCIPNSTGKEPDLGTDWINVVTRYGSGSDDPQNDDKMSTGGYSGLKEGNYCPIGTAYNGLVAGGNFVIKGVEANADYNVVIEMATGSPIITITKK